MVTLLTVAAGLSGVFSVYFLVRLLCECFQIHTRKDLITKFKNDKKTVTVISLGSGGHTTEMLRLINSLGSKFAPRVYVVANADEISEEKIRTLHSSGKTMLEFEIVTVPRSRSVQQPYLTSVITTVYSCLYCLGVMMRTLPDLVDECTVICNGPGTCIPLCVAVFLLRVVGIHEGRIIFVESICRVDTISLSGKILYCFADEFLVQWPHLINTYPRAKYLGRLV